MNSCGTVSRPQLQLLVQSSTSRLIYNLGIPSPVMKFEVSAVCCHGTVGSVPMPHVHNGRIDVVKGMCLVPCNHPVTTHLTLSKVE